MKVLFEALAISTGNQFDQKVGSQLIGEKGSVGQIVFIGGADLGDQTVTAWNGRVGC